MGQLGLERVGLLHLRFNSRSRFLLSMRHWYAHRLVNVKSSPFALDSCLFLLATLRHNYLDAFSGIIQVGHSFHQFQPSSG